MAAVGPTSSGPANRAAIDPAAIVRVSIVRAWTAPGWTVRRRVRGWMIVGDRISADGSSPAWIGRESVLVWDGRTLAITPIVVGFQA